MPTKGWKQARAERLGLEWPEPSQRPQHSSHPWAKRTQAKGPTFIEPEHPERSTPLAEHAADPTALRELARLEEQEWL